MPYSAQYLMRINLRSRRLLGWIKRDDPQDKIDFIESCVEQLEGEGVEDAENVCELLWEEGGYE